MNEGMAFDLLFRGRINVAQAAKYCNISTNQMKEDFRRYALTNKPEDWQLDSEASWPYA